MHKLLEIHPYHGIGTYAEWSGGKNPVYNLWETRSAKAASSSMTINVADGRRSERYLQSIWGEKRERMSNFQRFVQGAAETFINLSFNIASSEYSKYSVSSSNSKMFDTL
jgi:hypothetical protein